VKVPNVEFHKNLSSFGPRLYKTDRTHMAKVTGAFGDLRERA